MVHNVNGKTCQIWGAFSCHAVDFGVCQKNYIWWLRQLQSDCIYLSVDQIQQAEVNNVYITDRSHCQTGKWNFIMSLCDCMLWRLLSASCLSACHFSAVSFLSVASHYVCTLWLLFICTLWLLLTPLFLCGLAGVSYFAVCVRTDCVGRKTCWCNFLFVMLNFLCILDAAGWLTLYQLDRLQVFEVTTTS